MYVKLLQQWCQMHSMIKVHTCTHCTHTHNTLCTCRYCLYPQEIVICFSTPARIRKLQILSHQYMIGKQGYTQTTLKRVNLSAWSELTCTYVHDRNMFDPNYPATMLHASVILPQLLKLSCMWAAMSVVALSPWTTPTSQGWATSHCQRMSKLDSGWVGMVVEATITVEIFCHSFLFIEMCYESILVPITMVTHFCSLIILLSVAKGLRLVKGLWSY